MDIPERRLDKSGNLLITDLPESEPGPQIPVKFTGSHRGNTTEFYIEKGYDYGANTIRYDLDGSHYYLCAEGNRVFLQLVAHQPDEIKYLFEVKHVNNQSDYMSIKSKKTGNFLASDEDGRAFMEEVEPSSMKDDRPTDRQTWFLLHFMETVKMERESTLHSCNFDSTNIDCSVTCQAQVEAC
ncbi:uncharacterized protein LOC111329178 isoform X2 [Stylophora pistillata]|uniref:Uncharacterized protein n=2 Tax=Stylophora pistillata TaxID=50429 RepID=A0A2B4SCQ2_STYPI|nr:uncharacterized protein LOC111329178 isoform X2 [Stylophora pistillata]PFX26312.1 hypothetical protein AWC38_SpisGene8994 [Stylophora pistillata]